MLNHFEATWVVYNLRKLGPQVSCVRAHKSVLLEMNFRRSAYLILLGNFSRLITAKICSFLHDADAHVQLLISHSLLLQLGVHNPLSLTVADGRTQR